MRIRKRRQNLASTIDHGRRLLVSGQDQETLQFLEKAVQEFPEDAEVQLLYATILLEFRPDDVASQAAKATELAPDDPVILMRAGTLLLGRGRHDIARSCFQRTREVVGPDFLLMPGLLNGEGILAMLDKDFELAEEKLRAAVADEPTSGPFACDLVRLLAVRGRRAEALEVIDEAMPRVKQRDNLERLRRKLINGAATE